MILSQSACTFRHEHDAVSDCLSFEILQDDVVKFDGFDAMNNNHASGPTSFGIPAHQSSEDHMITAKSAHRASIASAAALFAFAAISATPAASAADAAKIAPCYGVNSCKGQSDCKSGDHACKGQNACKGQGFKDITAKECAAEHGTTEPKQK